MIIQAVILFLIFQNRCSDTVEAFIKMIVCWCMFVIGSINILSIFSWVNIVGVSTIYILGDIILVLFYVQHKKKAPGKKGGYAQYIYILFPLLIFWTPLFIYSLHCIPYNWDSMTYHLARIVNWEQNQSVNYYATSIIRQTASPVLGAYINLYVYILTGKNEVFLNLLQCISCGSNMILIYALTRRLGGKQMFSIMASILFVTAPIAFAEATTTQVDHFAALWLLMFVYLMFDLTDEKVSLKFNYHMAEKVIFGALIIALGYLTKPSVCFGYLIFLIWILIVCLRRKDNIKVIFKLLILTVPTVLLPIIPEWIRNFSAFSVIAHSSVGQRQLVGTLRPNYLLINFLKNFTYNLAVEWLPESSSFFQKSIEKLSILLNVSINDPSISEDGRIFEFPSLPAMNCDSALNPFLLYLACLGFLWLGVRIKRQSKGQVNYGLFAFLTFSIFCIFLRWEPFISRYMISYLALLCPFIALQLQDFSHVVMKNKFALGIGVVIVAGCVLNYKAEVGYIREISPFTWPQGYFIYNKELENDYIRVTDYINQEKAEKIGLYIDGNSYEYPLWKLLEENNALIKHINVNNELNKFEDYTFIPEYIIAVNTEISTEDEFECHGEYFKYVDLGTEKALVLKHTGREK